MTKLYTTTKVLLLTCFILALASATQAQSRTWVSGVGDDMNPCSRTAPCKTFAGAISKTAKDGEIDCLDPGGFGAVTINKSISINGTHGAGFGAILSSATTGIIVNISDVNDVRKAVRLRSLDINGASTGVNGVNILAANNVWVEDCVIDGTTGNGTTTGMGIRVSTSASCNVFVSDTIVHKNTTGIRATTTAGFAVVNIKNCNIEGNSTGVEANNSAFITVENSRIAANTTNGVLTSAATAQLNVKESALMNNGTAINAAAGSTIRAISNLIVNNTTGFGGTTAAISSDNQNRTGGNGGGGPTGPPVTLQ